MEIPEAESTDASSIKPVSSLRSHFENMRSLSHTNYVPMFHRPPGIPTHIEPERGRSSLDIPRKGSPWNTSSEIQSSAWQQKPTLTSSESGVPRDIDNGASPRQRPVSMGPWSPPRTPPTFKVQPPRSPPKPISLARKSSPAFEQQLFALPPVPEGLKSPYAPPVPQSRSPNRSPIPGREVQGAQNASVVTPSHSSNFGSRALQAGIGQIAMPPPINRADKPKLTPTCLTPNSHWPWAKLEPASTKVEDRVSPFSTPPSSEGSPEIEDRAVKLVGGTKFLKKAQPTQAGGYFPPPPTHHAVEARFEAQNKAAVPKQLTSDAHGSGLTVTMSNTAEGSRQRHKSTPRQEPNITPNEHIKRSETTSVAQQGRTVLPQQILPNRISRSSTEFLPPPKRNTISSDRNTMSSRSNNTSRPSTVPPSRSSNGITESLNDRSTIPSKPMNDPDIAGLDTELTLATSSTYPDATQTNRRPPWIRSGKPNIDTTYDTRLFDICSRRVCATGYLTKAWDIKSGKMIMDIGHGERDIKITAIAFKPAINADQEGARVWIGSNYGDLQEIDLESQSVIQARPQAHARREIIKLYRRQKSLWSLDDDGKLHVWLPDDQGLPSLQSPPISHKVSKGHSFSIVIEDHLWLATGKELRIYRPGVTGDASFSVIQQPLTQSSAGEITSGAVVSSQLDRIYFGHNDGKVSVYSTTNYSCLAVINVSVYKINTLAGVGFYLWAGYNTGMIYVYDTKTKPWKVKKDWQAHDGPVLSILADRSSVWNMGYLQVASIGVDNSIKIWDGVLEDDWLEDDMHEHDTEYCEFGEITAVIATWNAGATTPESLRHDERSNNFFREVASTIDRPDIIVFGFQELVDLEDKKLTAKSLFKGNKKKDSSEQEHMSRQYRAWRDYLVRIIDEKMPADQPYHLLHTASMVGLFSCIFVKESIKNDIRELQVAEIKRGLGGFHGNKGALILRFVLCDSSLCFVNCHLAAGQSQTVHRNNDLAAILEAIPFPMERDPSKRIDMFIGGGDGSMIMDHEICILNGDLNYRIDTMGQAAVVKAIKMGDLAKLQERDQLLVSRRRNPGFRLRSFNEAPITFAPTYKYDVGTDNYDSSEKHRPPAWCDRILYRGVGRIKQLDYRRHELRVSDHRPVSGVFKMRVKSISPKKRVVAWQACEKRFAKAKQRINKEIQIDYLINELGVNAREAASLIKR